MGNSQNATLVFIGAMLMVFAKGGAQLYAFANLGNTPSVLLFTFGL